MKKEDVPLTVLQKDLIFMLWVKGEVNFQSRETDYYIRIKQIGDYCKKNDCSTKQAISHIVKTLKEYCTVKFMIGEYVYKNKIIINGKSLATDWKYKMESIDYQSKADLSYFNDVVEIFKKDNIYSDKNMLPGFNPIINICFDNVNNDIEFLQNFDLNELNVIVDEAPTTGQSKDFDFDKLENSNLPVINTSIFDPDFIFENYHNKAFICSRFAFDAWLVHGKVCKEKITWTYISRENKVSKAQLKKFIDKITDTDTAKEAYFKRVFGIEVKKSDYKDARLNSDFKELSYISDKKKFKR